MTELPPAYEGGRPYIFISYAHKDSALVLPAIEALEARGYPVWYDAGIEVGSEWPEYIANHLLNCALVVAFISEASIESPNCRQEIVYALDKRKPMITVRLDNAPLPAGMEMQLNLCQSLLAYKHKTLEDYVNELAGAPYIAECLNEAAEAQGEAAEAAGTVERVTCSFSTTPIHSGTPKKKENARDEEVAASDILERFIDKTKSFFDTKNTQGDYKYIDVAQNKVMAVLAYFGLLVLLPIFLAKDSKYARFHINQGLLFTALTVAFNLVAWLFSLLTGGVFFFLLPLGDVLLLALLVFQVIRVIRDESRELPIIGRIRLFQ